MGEAAARGSNRVLWYCVAAAIVALAGAFRLEAELRGGLPCAAYGGHVRALRMHLFLGADPDDGRPFSGPPLSLAAGQGHIEAVCVLLDAGADVNAVGEGGAALCGAARHAHVEVVALLLARGADPNVASPAGDTPLAASLRYHHLEIAAMLLDAGADIEKRNRLGATPLLDAALWGDEPVARLLLEHGADPNADKGEFTPLLVAALRGNASLAALLLKHGADPNKAVGRHPCTPLRLATDPAIRRMLLAAGGRESASGGK